MLDSMLRKIRYDSYYLRRHYQRAKLLPYLSYRSKTLATQTLVNNNTDNRNLWQEKPFNDFTSLCDLAPAFYANGEQIILLNEPKIFYNELKVFYSLNELHLGHLTHKIIKFIIGGRIEIFTIGEEKDFISRTVHRIK